MSFRKRNTVINRSTSSQQSPTPAGHVASSSGVRASPLDGRPTTSTGTSSLDSLLAGHAGLALGTSLLIGEHGTTDFAGVLLRYYAAEGLIQGHHVHVLGLHDSWRGQLPGLSTDAASSSRAEGHGDKMKIAWRYEALAPRGTPRGRDSAQKAGVPTPAIFCHALDLTKKLSADDIKGEISFSPATTRRPGPSRAEQEASPLQLFVKEVAVRMASSASHTIHRVVIGNLLSPTLYPSQCCCPEEVLQFLHRLRALLRLQAARLTVMVTVPLSLFPRSTGLSRWMELLCDGVVELVPLQLGAAHAPLPAGGKGKADSRSEEQAQGLVRVHSLPVYHEKGGAGSDRHAGEDMSFSLSRSRGLILKPFSLPPLLDDDRKTAAVESGQGKGTVDF